MFSGKNWLVSIAPSTAAAPAAPISAIAATAASTAKTATALRLGSRFVDIDRASADRGSIQSGDRLLAIFIAGHFHESETPRSSGVSVCHDAHAVDLSERLKQLPQFVFICVEAKVPHKNILHASASALSCRKCKQFGGLGRSGGPFLKIETGASEQSNAGRSIAGFRKPACQIDFTIALSRRPDELALVYLPVPLRMKTHLQQTVLGIMSLAAAGTDQISAPRRTLMIVVLRHSECRPATAGHEEHAQRRLVFCDLLGLASRFHDSSTVANDLFLR